MVNSKVILGDLDSRRKIQDLVAALDATEELPLTTVANGIEAITKDGKVIQFGHLEKDIPATKIYDALVEEGILKRTTVEVVRKENRYTINSKSKYSKYFKQNVNSVVLKSGFEKLFRISLLNKIVKKIRGEGDV